MQRPFLRQGNKRKTRIARRSKSVRLRRSGFLKEICIENQLFGRYSTVLDTILLHKITRTDPCALHRTQVTIVERVLRPFLRQGNKRKGKQTETAVAGSHIPRKFLNYLELVEEFTDENAENAVRGNGHDHADNAGYVSGHYYYKEYFEWVRLYAL
jgi:hypothetical protein